MYRGSRYRQGWNESRALRSLSQGKQVTLALVGESFAIVACDYIVMKRDSQRLLQSWLKFKLQELEELPQNHFSGHFSVTVSVSTRLSKWDSPYHVQQNSLICVFYPCFWKQTAWADLCALKIPESLGHGKVKLQYSILLFHCIKSRSY